MAVEFITEESAASPPPAGGIEFLDGAERGGVELLPDPGLAAEPEDIEARLADPFYGPTLEEFKTYRRTQKHKPWFQPGKWAALAGTSVVRVMEDLWRGAKAVAKEPFLAVTGLPTVAEGAARGTYDLGLMGRGILQRIPYFAMDLNEDQFIQAQVGKLNEQAFSKGIDANTMLIQRQDLTKDLEKQFKDDYQEYKLTRDYDRFLIDRSLVATREIARRGEGNLLPFPPGAVNADVAETLSYVLDPTLAVPAVSGQKLLIKMAARGAQRLGAGVEAGGRFGRQLAERPGEFLEGQVQRAAGTPFETFAKAKAAVIEAPFATLSGGAGAVESSGQALRAIGEQSARGASQFGIFERIAKDATKPPWLRKSARLASTFGGDRLLPVVGTAAGGAIEGAALGAGLGFASGGMEGAASGFGAGGVLGAGGALAARAFTGASRSREAEDADVAHWAQRRIRLGDSPEVLGKLNQETALAAATADQIFGGALEIQFVDSLQYAQISKDNLGAAFFQEGSGGVLDRVIVNVDAISRGTHSNFLHELGHALFKSPLVDKSQISSAVHSIYGADALKKAADEYARKLAGNEKLRLALDATRGNVSDATRRKLIDSITREDVEAVKQRLTTEDPDWGVGEVFAEQFLDSTFGESLNRLRKGAWKGSALDTLLRPLLTAKAKVLGALGVPLDERAGGGLPPRLGREALFQDFQIRQDLRLSKMISGYLRDRDRFLVGVDAVKELEAGGARVTLNDLKDHPAAGWEWNAKQGYAETEYAIKLPNGEVILKPPKAIEAFEQKRVEDLRGLFPQQPLSPNDPRVGPKQNAAGVTEIRGELLPDGFFQLESFSLETRRAAKQMQDAMKSGETFNAWHQFIGTGAGKDSWSQSVRRGLGNLRVSQRDFKPINFLVTNPGNLVVTVLDVTSTLRKMVRWQSKGLLSDLWGGELNLFRTDMERYLKNHSEGLAGDANGIGTTKKNKLNAFFGVTDRESHGFNPLRAALRGEDKKSLVKSFRIDRMQNVKPTGSAVWWFDYGKQKRNLMTENLEPRSNTQYNEVNEKRYILETVAGTGQKGGRGLRSSTEGHDSSPGLGGVYPREFVVAWRKADPEIKQPDKSTEFGSELERVDAIISQEQSLLEHGNPRWGQKLIDQLVANRLERQGGNEHRVFILPRDKLVIKATHPGRYGFARDTPLEYLSRMQRLNDQHPVLGIKVVGVTSNGMRGSIITSMKYIAGRHPKSMELHNRLLKLGWTLISGAPLAYKHPAGMVMLDAHPGNFKITPSGDLVPIDVWLGTE